MDTSKTRARLQGAAKIFEAGLKSKTWDIHGMPQFITTTHHKGCDMCEAYALHVMEVVKALMVEIPPREVKKAFRTAWPNIVRYMEDEASTVSIRKLTGIATAMTIRPMTSEWQRTRPLQSEIVAKRQMKS